MVKRAVYPSLTFKCIEMFSTELRPDPPGNGSQRCIRPADGLTWVLRELDERRREDGEKDSVAILKC